MKKSGQEEITGRVPRYFKFKKTTADELEKLAGIIGESDTAVIELAIEWFGQEHTRIISAKVDLAQARLNAMKRKPQELTHARIAPTEEGSKALSEADEWHDAPKTRRERKPPSPPEKSTKKH